MNFPTLPSMVPAVTTSTGVATISASHGAGIDGYAYHDQVTYDIFIIGPNGPSPIMEGIKPTNEWLQGTNGQPRLKIVPATAGSEWPCQILGTRFMLWTWETPAVAPCNGDGGGTVDIPPGSIDADPIGDFRPYPNIPIDIPVSGRMAPMLRVAAQMTSAELATLGDMIDIARKNRQ